MKQTLTVAHARNSAPLYVRFTQFELQRLRCHSWLAQCLYRELVCRSDLHTGRIYQGSDPRVSYAMLIALLTPDAPAHGGRREKPPTIQQIRTALADLERDGLITHRPLEANRGTRCLFLEVLSRKEAAALTANRNRENNRSKIARKPNADGASRQIDLPISTEVPTGVSGRYFELPKEVSDPPHLSTGDGPKPPQPDEPPGPIALPPRGGQIEPPRGLEPRPAGAGHAPGEATDAMSARERVMAMRDELAATMTERSTRRPRNTVLKDEDAKSGRASPSAGHRAEPPEGRRGHE